MRSAADFDCTGWQRDYFSDIPLDDFLHNAQVYDQKNCSVFSEH
jgi:hypothetical protein